MVIALGACSSAEDDGPCRSRTGRTYLVQFTERSGSCGQLAEQIVTVNDDPPPAGCSYNNDVSDDSCHVIGESTCPGETVRADIRWTKSGSRGEGVFTLSQTAAGNPNGGACQSSYDVVYTER